MQLLCILSILFFFFFIVSQSAEVLGEAGKRRVPNFHGHTEYQHLDSYNRQKLNIVFMVMKKSQFLDHMRHSQIL